MGCIPRRASRSQRNVTPSYYLSHIGPDKITVTSSNLQNSVLGSHACYSDADKTSFSCLGLPSQSPAVYPLFFEDLQPKDSQFNFGTPSSFNFGAPSKLSSHFMNASDICAKQNSYGKAMASSKSIEADIKDTIANSFELGCDLSLRLGCLASPLEIMKTRIDKDLGNLSLRTPQGNKLIDSSIQIDKSFLKKSYFCESVDTCSADGVIEAEKLNLKKTPRKRTAVMDHLREDEHFSWNPKLPHHDCTGRARNAGL